MPEEKLTRSQRKKLLEAAARERMSDPYRYQEFICPCCEGIASVIDREDVLEAECHACSLRVVKKK